MESWENLEQICRSCTGCGLCMDNCPAGCIHHTYFPNLPEGVTAEDLMN